MERYQFQGPKYFKHSTVLQLQHQDTTMKTVTALLGAVTIALANDRVNAGLLGISISKPSKNGALLL